MTQAWQALEAELQRWQDAGRTPAFWWRDDDATQPTPAVLRLLGLSDRSGVPLALAVIPEGVGASLLAHCPDGVSLIQHGTDHVNRAGAGQKKTEYPASEPVDAALARLAGARDRLRALAGARLRNVFAPPWNRIHAGLAARLPDIGIAGLTAFGTRPVRSPAGGPVQVNTHVDIIDWRGGRRFAGAVPVLAQAVAQLAARRTGRASADEPTGWLTHHACHDEEAWSFLARLFDCSRRMGVRWLDADHLFSQSCN